MFVLKEYSYNPPILTFDSPIEIIEEELIESPEKIFRENNLLEKLEPKMIEMNSNKIQKTVNYFNHKFVISDTEDISVETLISQQPQICNAKKRKIEHKMEIKPKAKESLLKPDLDNERFQKNCQSKVFIIKNGQMIPILPPSILSSGIFKSTNLTKTEEFVYKKPLENVVYTNTVHKGNILPLNKFNKHIHQTTIVSLKSSTSHSEKPVDVPKMSSNGIWYVESSNF